MTETAKHTSGSEQQVVDALILHSERGARPEFPFDDLNFTLNHAAQTMTQMARERAAEREEVEKLSRALRGKDSAMGVLFQRMREADVDYSDLLP